MWVEANSGSGGGGGTETETTLWTNPSPNATFTGGGYVTLSDSYTNYKKICFYYKPYRTLSSESTVKYDKEEIDKWCLSANQNYGGAICAYYSSKITYRVIARHSTDADKFSFGECYENGTTTKQTSYCIPTKITGIN